MRRMAWLGWAIFAAGFGLAPASPELPALHEVIQKNIKARGGAANWQAVQTMKITGTYRAFSEPAPFTIWRKRPDKYRFDHAMLDRQVTTCYDGERAWWVNPLMGDEHASARVIPAENNHDKVTLREKIFEPVFWRADAQVELLGMGDVDGEPAYRLKVILPDSSEETWYIDAGSFLETKMEGDTYDFGRRVSMESYFSDYRETGGIKLPFRIEQEFGIRYRYYTIDTVEVNLAVDDAVFALPGGAK